MAICVSAPRILCRQNWAIVNGCRGVLTSNRGVGSSLACRRCSGAVVVCWSNGASRSSFAVDNRVKFVKTGGENSVSNVRRAYSCSGFLSLKVFVRSFRDFQARSVVEHGAFFSHGEFLEDEDEELEGEEEKEEEEEEQENLEFSRKAKGELKPGLYLVGTPIGNLEDITLRALRVLKSAALILAEDTRHSSRLLRHYEITTPTMSFHKFNEVARRDMVIERLRRGEVLAVISDAGMPGISDPGSDIVRACIDANVKIYPIPGPSAVITALVASGLPTDQFSFVGFLPAQSGSRQKRLAVAAKDYATQVFYVPPHKLCRILNDCISAFGPSRRCAVAREMTKFHEEFWRGTLEQAQTEFQLRSPRGEMTFIVEGLPEGSRDQPMAEDEIKSRLQSLMNAGKSASEATKQVVLETSARRNTVYPLALAISQKRNS